MNCTRPDCANPLKTGGKYCSPKCAAMDRSRVKAEKVTVISSGKTIVDDIPTSIMATVDRAVGEDGRAIILQEMSTMLQEGNIPIPSGGNTLGDWTLSFDGKKEYRSNDTLDFDKIDMILRSGPAVFAMEMKRAMITRNFSRGRFKVDSPDKELASVAQAVLEVILPTIADEFTWSALAYGTSFQEQVWNNKTKYELGLSSSRSAGTTFAVPDVPNSVGPKTIDHIRRGAAYEFDGFEQKRKANNGLVGLGDNIVVKPPAALVIPFQSHFRNLWGQSIFKPVYPIWLWYEITLRTLARYMERMAMPVALGKAPMRGMLQIEGQTAPVKSMDLMLAVAANVAKSNAVVIPSDYDEAGHAKYDLSYLTAQEKGSEFISVLRLLAGEMVRAVVISEQAVSPGDSAGGSYNAAAIQAQSTAISNLLIELSFVSYLNRYFMPNFSLFNRGENGPPIRLVTENADSEDRDLIIKLMSTMGNSSASQSFYEMLDMRTLGELSHIPMLSEADAKRKADEKFKEGLDHQEAQQELISKYAVNKDGMKQFGGVPPTDNKKPPAEDKSKDTQEKLEAVGVITKALIDGREVPWVLGLEELEALNEKNLIPEEVAIRLFNPFHDRRGLFAHGGSSGGGVSKITPSGGGAGGVASSLVAATNQAKSKPGSVIGTLGTILGIAGLGAVGLMAVAAISANASEPEINPQAKEKEVEAQQKLTELTKNWPKYQSADEAFSSVMGTLKSDGIDIPDGAKLQIGNFPPEVLKKYPTAIGLYDSNTNTMYIADDLASSIKNGDPAAVDTLAHELSHADQVVSKEFPYGENPEMVGNFTQDFSPLIEGQNDLLTSVEMSKMYKQPIGPDNIPQLSNEFAHLQNRLNTSKTGVTIINSEDWDIVSHGYEQEAKLWAVIATEGSKNTGTTPTQYLSNAHKNGFNAQTQHQNLIDAFPKEMESGGFIKTTNGKVERTMPSQSEIRKWATAHGYTDLSKAYNQMLQEAAK